jgi:hypothetical protein
MKASVIQPVPIVPKVMAMVGEFKGVLEGGRMYSTERKR